MAPTVIAPMASKMALPVTSVSQMASAATITPMVATESSSKTAATVGSVVVRR